MKLNVALYPWGAHEYVDKHRRIIEHYWYDILGNHQIILNWIDEKHWDGGYRKTPQEDFDVFIYDAIYMEYYKSRGWLSAFNRTDLTYAHEINEKILSLIECENGKYYGIPIYGCIYVLYYHSDDRELAEIRTFDDLVEIASRRHFIMRKPSNTAKKSNYYSLNTSIDRNQFDTNLTKRLSHFYQLSKSLLSQNDSYPFKHSSFYIGYTEDINTMLLLDENEFSQIDCMFVPIPSRHRPQCWIDCIGVHSSTKQRGTYEKSLQLANLMTSSSVINECLNGKFYLLPTNQITLSYLASNNLIYRKLQILIESDLFQPYLSLPMVFNSSLSIQEQWSETIALLIAQHQKEMQSKAKTNTAAS